MTLKLLNESAIPVEDITVEVEEENEVHRIYFSISPNSLVNIDQLNTDNNGLPLGTESNWSIVGTGMGSITVTLRHYPGTPPDKQLTDPVNSPKSSTDVEVTFPVKIL